MKNLGNDSKLASRDRFLHSVQVELLLKRGKPSTRCSIYSEDWRGERLEPSEPMIARAPPPPTPPVVPLTMDINRDSNALKSIAGIGLAAGGQMPRPRH